MSIVAWDGKTLAADRRMVSGELPLEHPKLFYRQEVRWYYAFTGWAEHIEPLMEWHCRGKPQSDYPAFQSGTNWTRMIVATQTELLEYTSTPYPIKHRLAVFTAFGAGRDLAIGAMSHGANAEDAVKIACRWNIFCGGQIDTFRVLAEGYPMPPTGYEVVPLGSPPKPGDMVLSEETSNRWIKEIPGDEWDTSRVRRARKADLA
jgi:hypothetical protein